MAKYTVITAIFGNFECLRDNQYQNKDVDYLCITDNPNLKSNTWKIIVNPEQINPDWSPRKKTYYVRYHLFDFCNTPNAMWIDGSIELNDITEILNNFDNSIYSMFCFDGCKFKDWFCKYSIFGDTVNKINSMDEEYFLFYYNKIQNLLLYLYKHKIDQNHINIFHINGRVRIIKNYEQNIQLMNECWELLNNPELLQNDLNIKRDKTEHFYDIYFYDEIIYGIVTREIYNKWKYDYNLFPFTVYKHNTNEKI